MPKGDPCRGKTEGVRCKHVKPCPIHTARGGFRVTPLGGGDVVEMFTDDRRKERKGRKDKTAAHEKAARSQEQIKLRLSRRWSKLMQDVRDGKYTWADVVEDMDAEELARARFKDSLGTWNGRPPQMVPSEFVRACHNEMMARFNIAFRENLQRATDELMRLALNSDMEDKDRARLLQYMIERVTGKVPDKIEVRQADPWEQIIDDIVSEVPTTEETASE